MESPQSELGGKHANAGFRRLMDFEVQRAHEMPDRRSAARQHLAGTSGGWLSRPLWPVGGRLSTPSKRPTSTFSPVRHGHPKRATFWSWGGHFGGFAGNSLMQVDLAYDYCQDVTRREAANFFYGIRLLPLEKRRALSAVYALARRVDDIGDGDLPASEEASRVWTASGNAWTG